MLTIWIELTMVASVRGHRRRRNGQVVARCRVVIGVFPSLEQGIAHRFQRVAVGVLLAQRLVARCREQRIDVLGQRLGEPFAVALRGLCICRNKR